jgi:hypothetical protein
MSRTGFFYAEVWKNSQWQPIPTPKFLKGKQIPVDCMNGASYEIYAALVGYERWSMYGHWYTEPIVPLSEPRGFPVDMNPIYKEHFNYNEYLESKRISISKPLYHNNYLTWFLVQEVIDYDWDKKFPLCTGYVKSQYASLFEGSASFPENFPVDENIYLFKEKDTIEVSWMESYREFVGCADWFIGELLKLGNPNEVRIIFWLNW